MIVSSVPRAVGHLNSPVEATPESQFVVLSVVGQAVNATVVDDNYEQPENISDNAFA